MEIVGAVSDANNVDGRLLVFDSKGERLYDQEFKYSLWLGGIADFGNDKDLEIVTTSSEGFLNIYNFKLETIRTYKVGGYIQSAVKGISDMDGNGSKEIIVVGWDGSVTILDNDLEEKWNELLDSVIPPIALVTNVSGCGNDLLILTKRTLEMYSFEGEGEYLCARFISPPTTTPPPPTPPPTETPGGELDSLMKWILSAIFAIATSIVGSWIYGKYFSRRKLSEEPVEDILEPVRLPPSASKHSIRLFLSYSGKDKEFIENFAEKLKSDHFLVWYDEWEIHVGEIIDQKIKEGISSSDFFLIVLSGNSVNSRWVKEELEEAKVYLNSKGVFILPVLLEECEIPPLLVNLRYADFSKDPDSAYRQLVRDIDYHSKRI